MCTSVLVETTISDAILCAARLPDKFKVQSVKVRHGAVVFRRQLEGCKVENVKLQGANLQGAKWQGAIWGGRFQVPS